MLPLQCRLPVASHCYPQVVGHRIDSRGIIGRVNSHRPVTEICQGTGMGSDSLSEDSPERRFRTLFISDVHLGARGSQADRLLDFLRTHDADTIYLVGDIVDGWR